VEWSGVAWRGVASRPRSPLIFDRHRPHCCACPPPARRQVLELVLRSSQYEDVVGLLIVFRLWRIVRVLHATEEIMHIEQQKKAAAAEAEVAELRRRLKDAEAALAMLQAARASNMDE
jgi:hypothetical protein